MHLRSLTSSAFDDNWPRREPLCSVLLLAQCLLGSKTWIGLNGQRPLLPNKSKGNGYMHSAFVAREVGFGWEMKAEEFAKVNDVRRGIHKTYLDTQAAATKILKATQKPLLTELPFVKYVYIGASNEDYWNSYHLSLQFEVVVDCLHILYSECQGHARKQSRALRAFHMSQTFAQRAQEEMILV